MPDRKVSKTDEEWKKQLTDEQYRVTRQGGTEMAFTGKYYNNKDTGMYHCICCVEALFSSDEKYDSAYGWPSLCQPVKGH